MMAGLVAALFIGWTVFKWAAAKGHVMPEALGASNASFVSSAFAQGEPTRGALSLTPSPQDSAFVVEVERSDRPSEVNVRVRATGAQSPISSASR